MSTLAAYRRLLGNGPLTRLLVGEFVSSIGDWLYLVALLVVVARESGDPVLLGIVGAARVLPYVILSVPAGIAADRFERRFVLLTTDVARAVIMLVLAWLVAVDGPLVAIVALAILATCFSTFFGPTIGAYLPTLARDEHELGPANSAWATLDNLAYIVGPAVAGLLIATSGLTLAFALNAASFTLVIVVLWSMPSRASTAAAPGPGPGPGPKSSVAAASAPSAGTGASVAGGAGMLALATEPGGEIGTPGASATLGTLAPIGTTPGVEAGASESPETAEGPRNAASARPRQLGPIVALAALDSTTSAVFGGLGVLTVVLASESLGTGDEATGVLNAAIGVGGLIGALIAGVLVLRARSAPPLLAGSLVLAIGLAGLAASVGARSLPIAFLALAVASVGSLVVEVLGTTLIQRAVPDEIRGRTLGSLATFSTLAFAAGSLIVPIAAGVVGVPLVLGVAALALVAVGVMTTVLVGRLDRLPPEVGARMALLRALGVFAGVNIAALESAARRMTIVALAQGQVVIREGDAPDLCYVVESGRLAVEREAAAGKICVDEIGPGEIVGELGLLRSAPRNATVVALEPARLLALDGADFLELVGESPDVRGRLLDLRRSGLASDLAIERASA